MTSEEIREIQGKLGLSDGKMAQAIGVTRQTWRNWRRGEKCPVFAQNALRWMMELRKVSPANDNLPNRVRVLSSLALAIMVAYPAFE
jgi:DNA-binding transcriptional regulator YiaG